MAFEVFAPALASTMARIARHGVGNVRIVKANGAEGLEHLFAPGSLTEVWTFFGPWHWARHHKRRLVSRVRGMVASAGAGRAWRLATDWEDYALAMREVLDHPAWSTCTADGRRGGPSGP